MEALADYIRSTSGPEQRLAVAFDYDDADNLPRLHKTLKELSHLLRWAKIHNLADEYGTPQMIDVLQARYQLHTMLDYKIFDIATTMFRRARALTIAGAGIITMHASASEAGMRAAREGVEAGMATRPDLERRPAMLGVTVLTSYDEMLCEAIFGEGRQAKVREFGHMAVDAGADGLVCNTREAEMFRSDSYTESMFILVPAIRPSYVTEQDEQAASAATPRQARNAGADMITVGRPVAQADLYGLTATEAVQFILNDMKI